MSAPQSTPAWAVGFVYLLDTSDRYQKIGFSRDPVERAAGFQQLPFCVWLAHCFPVGAKAIEAVVHRAFAAKRVRGEWFVLSREEVAAFCEVRAVRTADELPHVLRPRIVARRHGYRERGGYSGRRPRPWFRTGRREWYVQLAGTQHRLGVADPDALAAVDAAARRLVGQLQPSRLADLQPAEPLTAAQRTAAGLPAAAGGRPGEAEPATLGRG